MSRPFRDRAHAAELLADRLQEYHDRDPCIYGLPRGGVPMARLIGDRLESPVDVVLVRKLRHPMSPELAIGSIDEEGNTLFPNRMLLQGVGERELKEEIVRQHELLRQRRELYAANRLAGSPRDRVVILVDDGIATGSTMLAALQSIRRKGPSAVVVAVPVAARSSVELIERWADEVISLELPEEFDAVGQFYEAFPQVTDEEVIIALTPQVP